MIAPPRQCANIWTTASRPCWSKLLVGSSSKIKSGCLNTKAASMALVCWPPESCDSRWCDAKSRLNCAKLLDIRASNAQSARSNSSAVALPASARDSSLSAPVTSNRSAIVSPFGLDTIWSNLAILVWLMIWPFWGFSSPLINLSKVVLPTPLRPTKPVRWLLNCRFIRENTASPLGLAHEMSDRLIEFSICHAIPISCLQRP